jgi:hypothetical protein
MEHGFRPVGSNFENGPIAVSANSTSCCAVEITRSIQNCATPRIAAIVSGERMKDLEAAGVSSRDWNKQSQRKRANEIA